MYERDLEYYERRRKYEQENSYINRIADVTPLQVFHWYLNECRDREFNDVEDLFMAYFERKGVSVYVRDLAHEEEGLLIIQAGVQTYKGPPPKWVCFFADDMYAEFGEDVFDYHKVLWFLALRIGGSGKLDCVEEDNDVEDEASLPQIREEVVAAINAFCEDDWTLAYTFGHIVLDDYNLSDGHIKFCLRQDTIDEWFNHALDDCDPQSSNPDSANEWERYDYDALTETRDKVICFLRWLLRIPELVREGETP